MRKAHNSQEGGQESGQQENTLTYIMNGSKNLLNKVTRYISAPRASMMANASTESLIEENMRDPESQPLNDSTPQQSTYLDYFNCCLPLRERFVTAYTNYTSHHQYQQVSLNDPNSSRNIFNRMSGTPKGNDMQMHTLSSVVSETPFTNNSEKNKEKNTLLGINTTNNSGVDEDFDLGSIMSDGTAYGTPDDRMFNLVVPARETDTNNNNNNNTTKKLTK